MNNPFRKSTPTHLPSFNMKLDSGRNNGYLYPDDPRFHGPKLGLSQKLQKVWRRHSDNLGGYFIVAMCVLALLFWCYWLYTGDVQSTSGFGGCEPGSQHIHGWSNGHYTNLCVDPVNR